MFGALSTLGMERKPNNEKSLLCDPNPVLVEFPLNTEDALPPGNNNTPTTISNNYNVTLPAIKFFISFSRCLCSPKNVYSIAVLLQCNHSIIA